LTKTKLVRENTLEVATALKTAGDANAAINFSALWMLRGIIKMNLIAVCNQSITSDP
jgi:hypothetical protein